MITGVMRLGDQPVRLEENQQFLEKVLLNDSLWEKLMAAD